MQKNYEILIIDAVLELCTCEHVPDIKYQVLPCDVSKEAKFDSSRPP